MTTHADEEADADGFDIFDIESAILAGEIVERQKDRDAGLRWTTTSLVGHQPN